MRTRMGDQSGFTLIELLVSVSLGMVVVLASFQLLDAASRASSEATGRVDATQRGRVAMEQITQRLRSQVCLDQNTPALTYADDNRVDFYAELGDAEFKPEARRLRHVKADLDKDGTPEGHVYEDVWTTLTSPPANTFSGAPNQSRVVLGDMGLALEDEPGQPVAEGRAKGASVPFFRYYAFLNNNPATPALLLNTPLSATDRARVVRISVSFDARPSRRAEGANRFDTGFENDVYVRTADPTDPEHSPQCL